MKYIFLISIILFAACTPFEVGQGRFVNIDKDSTESLNRPYGNSNVSTPQNNINTLPNGFYRALAPVDSFIVFFEIQGDKAAIKLYDPYYQCAGDSITNISYEDDGDYITFNINNHMLEIGDFQETTSSRYHSFPRCPDQLH